MPRVLVVLPIYFAAMIFIPPTAAYKAFGDWLVASQAFLPWHLIAYAWLLPLSIKLTLMIEDKARTDYLDHSFFVFAVLRLGLIGVIVMCGYQLFSFFMTGRFNIYVVLTPLIFMVAEAVYEMAELVRGRARR